MLKDWKPALISTFLSVVLAVGTASYSWTYQAGKFMTEIQQIKSEQLQNRELVRQLQQMNENLLIIQTEMKYYRRDIDDLRKKQSEISTRLDGYTISPVF